MLATSDNSNPIRRRKHAAKPMPDIEKLPGTALLARRQVAALTGYAGVTLKRWADLGRGPKIVRIEGRPRYRVDDLREWLAGQ